MLYLDIRLHEQPDSLFFQPVTEFNILQYGHEAFIKAAAFLKKLLSYNHGMGGYVIRVCCIFCLGVMDVDGLEDAEECLVIGQQGVGSANDGPGTFLLIGDCSSCQGVGLQEAVVIYEKEHFACAVLGPGISCHGSAAMFREADEPAGIFFNDG